MGFKFRKIPHYIRKAPAKLRLAYKCIQGPYFKWVPPGHYFSALPDMEEVSRRSNQIYALEPGAPAGIDLRKEGQAKLLAEFENYYSEPPFERRCNPRSRFYRPNGSFPFQDAFVLYSMIRYLRPVSIIEVGCGYSSCVILDSCEAQRLETKLTFIEPYPESFLGLIRPGDRSRFELKQAFIQDISPDTIASSLKEGDILFIDTSHVSKVGSDVNYIFFEILPLLKRGVVVHFHDIFYPFEYPHDWLLKGMFWNEAYLLRSFLMFNPAFEILLFNSYLNSQMKDRIKTSFPLFLEEPGASIWLRRV